MTLGVLIPENESMLGRFYNWIEEKIFNFANEVKEESKPENVIYASADRAEIVLDKYGNSILRMAYSYLHNEADAEEVLQDTLLQYLRTSPILQDENHEKAWLLHVAANLSKNRIKYNQIRHTDELNEELCAEDREDLSFVWDAVKELPWKYREVVHLYYYEGYDVKKIAGILDRNESTVRSDLKRGREKLKEILKEAYDFEG